MAGRALFERLGQPRKIVAPMVDMSELAWRKLCRRHGAQLCYTPMFNAKLFANNERYREDNFGPMDGDPATDRPLIVQFCANEPDELLKAAKLVVGRCDAVDLNLGCPQGIARRGHYGAFLMEEWDLIHQLINKLHTELPDLPVTAKIRRYPTKEKTIEYAGMVESAGAQFIGVHGRTREMKGVNTGLADWSYIKGVRDSLSKDTVVIANGNIIYREDFDQCLKATGADAVMTAETCLANPAVFGIDNNPFPRVDKLAREYFDIARNTDGRASMVAIKSHLFKLLRNFFTVHTDIRNKLGPIRSGDWDAFEEIVSQIEARVDQLATDEEPIKRDADGYWIVPHWRAQPTFRVVNGVSSKNQDEFETESRKRGPQARDDAAEENEKDSGGGKEKRQRTATETVTPIAA